MALDIAERLDDRVWADRCPAVDPGILRVDDRDDAQPLADLLPRLVPGQICILLHIVIIQFIDTRYSGIKIA